MPCTLKVAGALKNPGQAYPFEADVPVEQMVLHDDPVRFESVHIAGTVMSANDAVNLLGEVSATVFSTCANCLGEARLPLKARMDVHYVRVPDIENPDLYLLEASTIELTDAVRDALLLELPMRFLCREDCRGFCPRCGANLNEDTCACQEGGEVANPFAALKTIFQNDEEV